MLHPPRRAHICIQGSCIPSLSPSITNRQLQASLESTLAPAWTNRLDWLVALAATVTLAATFPVLCRSRCDLPCPPAPL
eukprot:3647052-Rhodomonas_salina.1